MITILWQKLPRCCRECHRIRRAGDLYECNVNLIFPTKKKSCGKQKWRKPHIRDRLVRFMRDNAIDKKYVKTRREYPGKKKKSGPWRFFLESFDLLAIPHTEWTMWAHISMVWQLVIEREYPEYVR